VRRIVGERDPFYLKFWVRLTPLERSRRFLVYTVNRKQRDILFLTITLANLSRFLQFLYHINREEILHATVVHTHCSTTSP